MKHHVVISGVLAATLVAGCAQKQLVEPASASTFRVTDVAVVLEDGPKRSAGFYEFTEADVAAKLRDTTLKALTARNPDGARDVVANVSLSRMVIANPGVGILVGQKTSGLRGTITIKDARSGEQLALTDNVTATTKPRPTLAGAAFIRSPEGELALIAEEFARRAAIAIFGDDPAAGDS
ncbi:hypothetical protein [Pseudaestuariivita atlantica]|uniref:Lipoprotein n=1 Tax=Pseudaestuariivita atlantica TaxID=1317121 RepID=A0A0L1JKQ8_9RHOB|nr:hypothetical protein [Pseudaestuariivita atlantica]KNG91973.1 hypothetical protein ATO11_19715 [Pseudaestuariivita atlantica]